MWSCLVLISVVNLLLQSASMKKPLQQKNLDAGKIIKEQVAPLIKGAGGGQKTLATAGGQDASNLQKVIDTVKNLLK